MRYRELLTENTPFRQPLTDEEQWITKAFLSQFGPDDRDSRRVIKAIRSQGLAGGFTVWQEKTTKGFRAVSGEIWRNLGYNPYSMQLQPLTLREAFGDAPSASQEPPDFDWESELDLDKYMWAPDREGGYGDCPIGISVSVVYSWDGEDTRSHKGLIVVELDSVWALILDDPEDIEGVGPSSWHDITSSLPGDVEEHLLQQYCDWRESRQGFLDHNDWMTLDQYENER